MSRVTPGLVPCVDVRRPAAGPLTALQAHTKTVRDAAFSLFLYALFFLQAILLSWGMS